MALTCISNDSIFKYMKNEKLTIYELCCEKKK